jgi:hypothetical protein
MNSNIFLLLFSFELNPHYISTNSNKTITLKGAEWSPIFVEKPVSKSKLTSFSIKIDKGPSGILKNLNMSIGICPASLKKMGKNNLGSCNGCIEMMTSYTTACVLFNKGKGVIEIKNKYHVIEGSTLQVQTDRTQNKVSFYVENNLFQQVDIDTTFAL